MHTHIASLILQMLHLQIKKVVEEGLKNDQERKINLNR